MITSDKITLNTGVLSLTGRNLYIDGSSLQTSFSKSTVIYNGGGIANTNYNFPIWRAIANCTLTGISAYMISGNSTGVVNCRKNMISGHLVTDMNITITGSWTASGIIRNPNYLIGDTLEAQIIRITGGAGNSLPLSITIQADFIK